MIVVEEVVIFADDLFVVIEEEQCGLFVRGLRR